MSLDEFKKAYSSSNIAKLRKYIKYDTVLSVPKFINYVEKSFSTNRDVYDVLALILFNKYDLDDVVKNIIERDNTELLENVLDNDYQIVLDETLIELTVPKGRVTMAKSIYEYIHNKKNSYTNIIKLLKNYLFVYDENENSIDSYVLALYKKKYNDVDRISHFINLGFWNNFAVKYISHNYSYCFGYNIQNILLSTDVDPGIGNNLPLRISLKKGNFTIANELLKHPLVTVNFNVKFLIYLIQYNCLYVAEKLLRTENSDVISIFKHTTFINNIITYHNDVTYLAIKLGILDVVQIIENNSSDKRKIEKYLENFKIDDEFILKSYEPDLDPNDVCALAFKNNDIELAKSIADYSISINVFFLLRCLICHRNDKNTDVYDYILNNKVKQFNSTRILYTIISLTPTYENGVDEIFEKILIVVKDNPKLKYKIIYDACIEFNCKPILMKVVIKEKCTKKEYREICRK